MRYRITETADYFVEAKSAQEALNIYLGPEGVKSPFPVDVLERDVYDADNNWCETYDE